VGWAVVSGIEARSQCIEQHGILPETRKEQNPGCRRSHSVLGGPLLPFAYGYGAEERWYRDDADVTIPIVRRHCVSSLES
jgi:hypothetical protein